MEHPMQPYGQALKDYYNGNNQVKNIIHREDGLSFDLPVKIFFKDPSEFSPIDNKALDLCFGKVLDIGAGTGYHSLALQNKGLDVTAIDIVPEAVEIMKKRGIQHTECIDIYQYQGKKFNTLLMMSHGIGITGNLDGFHRFLDHAFELTTTDGILVFDSLDVRETNDPANLAYHEHNRRIGRYIGEINWQFEYNGIKGPPVSWLHIDPDTLKEELKKSDWTAEVIHQEPTGDYLVKLSKK